MNAKRMMKCLLATVLMVLLVLQTVPALAVDVEPVNPDPEPTPEPEPEEPSCPSYTRPRTIKEDKSKEITLTNGKAVLKAPEALFWTGYEVGQGGGPKLSHGRNSPP